MKFEISVLACATLAANSQTLSQIPFFEQVLAYQGNTEWAAKIASYSAVPGYAYSVDKGLPMSLDSNGNPTFEGMNKRRYELEQKLAKFTGPLTLNNLTMPAVFFGAYQSQHLESPEQYLQLAYSPEDQISLMENEVFKTRFETYVKSFTDTETLEDTFYETSAANTALNVNWLIKKADTLTPAQEARMDSLFPSLKKKRDYYVLDTEYLGSLKARVDPTGAYPTRHGVGAFTILDDKLKPIATHITMQDTDGKELQQTFTKESSSGSAWRLALFAAKASITAWIVPAGHTLGLHTLQGGLQAAFYNTIPEEHPLFALLEPHHKYTIQFNTLFLMGAANLGESSPFDANAMAAGDLNAWVPMFELWNKTMTDIKFTELRPSVYMKNRGLDRREYQKQDFVKSLNDMEKMAQQFARDVVNQVYKNNAAVASDPALKAFYNFASIHGRFGALTDSGCFCTKKDLIEYLTLYMYLTISHGSGRSNIFGDLDSLIGIQIPSFTSTAFLKKPISTEYSVKEMLRHFPDTKTTFAYNQFTKFFTETTRYEPLIDNDDLEKDLKKIVKDQIKDKGYSKTEIYKYMDKFPSNIES